MKLEKYLNKFTIIINIDMRLSKGPGTIVFFVTTKKPFIILEITFEWLTKGWR